MNREDVCELSDEQLEVVVAGMGKGKKEEEKPTPS